MPAATIRLKRASSARPRRAQSRREKDEIAAPQGDAVAAKIGAVAAKIDAAWVRDLAKPYLRGYRPVAARENSLRGFWFLHPQALRARKSSFSTPTIGFFVGYLVDEMDVKNEKKAEDKKDEKNAQNFAFLKPVPPECLVFAFILPVGKELHRRLVADPDSLVRKTATYIRWLTHRPPHFVFLDNESIALVRHQSMREWPREKYQHFSRNFFIETLAWLVRSALVRRLLAEPLKGKGGASRKSS
jgi:hypothetical protein